MALNASITSWSTWDYVRQHATISTLYEQAKTSQWNAAESQIGMSRDWLMLTSADVAAAWLPMPGPIELDPLSLRPGRSARLAVPGCPGLELADCGRPVHGTIGSIVDEQRRALPGAPGRSQQQLPQREH
jgi:hypothetical protein